MNSAQFIATDRAIDNSIIAAVIYAICRGLVLFNRRATCMSCSRNGCVNSAQLILTNCTIYNCIIATISGTAHRYLILFNRRAICMSCGRSNNNTLSVKFLLANSTILNPIVTAVYRAGNCGFIFKSGSHRMPLGGNHITFPAQLIVTVLTMGNELVLTVNSASTLNQYNSLDPSCLMSAGGLARNGTSVYFRVTVLTV